jgi:hypothetical protein
MLDWLVREAEERVDYVPVLNSLRQGKLTHPATVTRKYVMLPLERVY